VTEAELPGCSVELTEFTAGREVGWTFALEAGGEPGDLEPSLRATAAALVEGPRPPGLRFDLADSMSYPRWLSTHRG
jgi:hypothetical protein